MLSCMEVNSLASRPETCRPRSRSRVTLKVTLIDPSVARRFLVLQRGENFWPDELVHGRPRNPNEKLGTLGETLNLINELRK